MNNTSELEMYAEMYNEMIEEDNEYAVSDNEMAMIHKMMSEMPDVPEMSEVPETVPERPSAEEFIENMTEEDFMDERTYKGLYLIKNEFRRKKLDFLMRKKARQIGKTNLEKVYTDMKNAYFAEKQEAVRKAQKAEVVSGTVDGITNYSGLPENAQNLDCGPDWMASDDGVFYVGNKIPRRACKQPVLITGIMKSVDTGEERVTLIYKNCGKWNEITCDKDTLASAQKITSLHKLGLSVTSRNARELVAFIQDMEDFSRSKKLIPITLTTAKMGWNREKTAFVPYADGGLVLENTENLMDLLETLQEKGDREAWYEKFRTVRGIPMIDFLTCANLSAPLVGMLQLDGFVANLYGPSRGGKSVSSKICCTFWASYESDYMYSCDNTNNSIEGILAMYGSLPFIMEDANNMKERQQKDVSTLIMKVSNGVGKARMRKDLRVRRVNRWKTTGIITSENRITNFSKNTGSVNRTLLMRGTDEKDCPFCMNGLDTDDLMSFFKENHGFLSGDFIRLLIEIGEEELRKCLKEITNAVKEKAREMKKSGGQTQPVAVMLLVDRILEEYIFKDGKTISLETAISWMADEVEADINQRFYSKVMDTVIQNSGKFEGLGMKDDDDVTISAYWGRYLEKKNQIAILPAVLKKLADDDNVDVQLFLESMDNCGWLEKDSQGNFTKNINSCLLHKGIRMYVISMPEEEEEKVEEENKETEFVQVSDKEMPFE